MNPEEQVAQQENVEHTQDTTIPMPEGEVEDGSLPSPKEESQPESPQAVNMRNMREAKLKAERERDELIERVSAIEEANKARQAPKPEPVEDFSIAPDDLVEGKHLSRYDKKIKELEGQLKNYQQQSTAATVEAKLHAQYPDFDKIVTKENVDMLSSVHPEIAQTISSSPDLYSKAVSAYTLIKKLGIHPENTYDSERARAQENAAKPRPLASVSAQQGAGPLSKANAFAGGLTDDLKKQLHREMVDAIKAR
jgi:hypothetical protein